MPRNLKITSGGGAVAPFVYPKAGNIVFRHDIYDGDTTAQVGSYTYSRTGTVAYEKNAEVVSVGANVLPIGAQKLGGTETMSGLYLMGQITNFLLYSEDFENAVWTDIGTPTVTLQATSGPDGGPAFLISGTTAGDGLAQDSGLSTGTTFPHVFTCYLKTTTGTATARLKVVDASGVSGTFVDCPLTTTWKRFEVPYTFASISTSVRVQIIVNSQTNIVATKAQLESFSSVSSGRRERFSTANPYVKTTSATASSGNTTYEIPNAVISGIATKGTISLWIMPEYDGVDITNSNGYLFSINEEVFAGIPRKSEGMLFKINGTDTVSSNTHAVYYMSPHVWNHYVYTWDTGTDTYSMYRNGELQQTSNNVLSAINIGANNLYIGRNSVNLAYVHADMIFSEILIWDEPLNATEALEMYNHKAPAAILAGPGTGKIFSVTLSNSPVPTIGDTKYFLGHRMSGQPYYYDSPTTMKQFNPIDYAAPAYPLGGYNKGGLQFFGQNTNYILQSEAPGTTWTAVGAPTITNSVGTFLGTLSYGTINGVSGEGIQQSATFVSANDECVGSCFVSVASGTLDFTIGLEGDSGGTPESSNQTFTATTTPQRFSFYKSFTGAATGNVRLKILLAATGTLRISGMMLERENDGPPTPFAKNAQDYIKTTTTTQTTGNSYGYYRMQNSINMLKGTIIAWGFLYVKNPDDFIAANGPTILGMPGQYNDGFYFHHEIDALDFIYTSIANRYTPFTSDRNIWYHYAIAYDATGGTPDYRLYRDGVLLQQTNSAVTLKLWPRFGLIGGDLLGGNHDHWQGAIDTLDIYGSAISTADILADFNATKAAYGK